MCHFVSKLRCIGLTNITHTVRVIEYSYVYYTGVTYSCTIQRSAKAGISQGLQSTRPHVYSTRSLSV